MIYVTRSEKTVHLLKFFKNAVAATTVALVEKLVPNLNNFLVKKWDLQSLVYILNKFKPKSSGKEVSVPLKGLLLNETEIGVV